MKIQKFLIFSWLFFKRDLLINLSYKFQFIMTFASLFIAVFIFYIFSNLFQEQNPYFSEYGDSYFYFLITGITVADFALRVSNTLNIEIRNYQVTGIFEEFMDINASLISLLMYSYIYPIFYGIFRAVIFLVFAIYFFDLNLMLDNLWYVLVSIGLSVFSFIGIGLMAGAYSIAFKRGNPLSSLNQISIIVISGVFFPTYLFPEWLYSFSQLIPITHSVELVRYLFIEENVANNFVYSKLLILSAFSIALFIIGYMLMKIAIKNGKKNGTLGFY